MNGFDLKGYRSFWRYGPTMIRPAVAIWRPATILKGGATLAFVFTTQDYSVKSITTGEIQYSDGS